MNTAQLKEALTAIAAGITANGDTLAKAFDELVVKISETGTTDAETDALIAGIREAIEAQGVVAKSLDDLVPDAPVTP